ncbi:unnamed protein product [Heterobilharzia americana]|nr:unnamed protein product [Heterobilharzia americana]CAH8613009.1 unnamed protein product [Heterobilharzia americana]
MTVIMNQYHLLILTKIILLSSALNFVKGDCIGLNADCSKTVFVQCCDPLSCELDSPFNGKCKLCLSAGSFCWRSSECCSKTCSWFKCTDPVKDLVKQITG